LSPDDQESQTRLRRRLSHAGIYSAQAAATFFALRLALGAVPFIVLLTTTLAGIMPSKWAGPAGAASLCVGIVLPGLWLDRRKARRQVAFARALPDLIDLLVACLEGGLSLQAGLQRVADEFRLAHPLLSHELAIVLREVEMGGSVHGALRHFAERSGTESVRSLATFVEHAQRFGTTLADAFRVHADMLRTQREQRAEELSQRAAVTILFPTLLFIFPATLVVLAGPAAIQLHEHFARPAGVFSGR
jgi:tight adherence protein C